MDVVKKARASRAALSLERRPGGQNESRALRGTDRLQPSHPAEMRGASHERRAAGHGGQNLLPQRNHGPMDDSPAQQWPHQAKGKAIGMLVTDGAQHQGLRADGVAEQRIDGPGFVLQLEQCLFDALGFAGRARGEEDDRRCGIDLRQAVLCESVGGAQADRARGWPQQGVIAQENIIVLELSRPAFAPRHWGAE